MMNKVWCLSLLLAFSLTADCVKLVNLCEKDHFKYNSVQVNSVYLSEHEIQLSPVKNFLIELYERCTSPEKDPPINPDHDREANEFYQFKDAYNQMIARIYSEKFLNNFNKTEMDMERKRADNWFLDIGKWLQQLFKSDIQVYRCFENIIRPRVVAGRELIDGLLPLFEHRFNNYRKSYVPNKEQLYTELQSAISHMSEHLESGQTMAFQDQLVDHVYEFRISSLPRFEFVRKSRVVFNYDSYLNTRYQIAFPFNSESFDSSAACLSADELPPFFRDSKERS